MKIPRKVTVEWCKDSWRVMYAERKKGTKYSPAGFYADEIHNLEWVKNWVRNNPKLKLIEP